MGAFRGHNVMFCGIPLLPCTLPILPMHLLEQLKYIQDIPLLLLICNVKEFQVEVDSCLWVKT